MIARTGCGTRRAFKQKNWWFSSYVELRELELDSSQELLYRCLEKLLLKLLSNTLQDHIFRKTAAKTQRPSKTFIPHWFASLRGGSWAAVRVPHRGRSPTLCPSVLILERCDPSRRALLQDLCLFEHAWPAVHRDLIAGLAVEVIWNHDINREWIHLWF